MAQGFTRAEKWMLAGTACAAAGAVGLLLHFDPNVEGNPFPPCPSLALTGYYCPGCGGTRALHALLHGDISLALSMNPVMVMLIPIIPALIAWSRGFRPGWLAPVMGLVQRAGFWLVLIPGYAIARNLPWYPFTLLAPG